MHTHALRSPLRAPAAAHPTQQQRPCDHAPCPPPSVRSVALFSDARASAVRLGHIPTPLIIIIRSFIINHQWHRLRPRVHGPPCVRTVMGPRAYSHGLWGNPGVMRCAGGARRSWAHASYVIGGRPPPARAAIACRHQSSTASGISHQPAQPPADRLAGCSGSHHRAP